MDETLALLALSRLPNLKNIQKKLIVDSYDNIADLFHGKSQAPEGIAQYFRDYRNISCLEEERNKIEKSGVNVITIKDLDYPDRLRHISDAPVVLYKKGPYPLSALNLSIVGARKATMEGIALAEKIAETLSSLGITIVSGLARGIDAAAHRGALKGQGKTIGVLGCGINICYPAENQFLFDRISKEGAILTEYIPGEKPLKHHFPERNRIIAGLSTGVLVVEASTRSGSLITARLALEYGRDVMAIPGRIFDEAYKGANSLIKQGAHLIEDIVDIVNYCFPDVQLQVSEHIAMDCDEEYVYKLIGIDRIHVDELIEKSGLETRKVMAILTRLEMKDAVQHLSSGFYIRKN
jgi:DNA processing protein